MSKIYQPKGRAREYSSLALNLYSGCTHGCRYCYVPRIFTRFRPGYDHAACRPQVDFDELERSAKALAGTNDQILLSFTGDPYSGVSPETTRRALEILLKYNHKVAILTKGGTRCLEDMDLFLRFGDRIKVGATLTFDNSSDSLSWEPGAAHPCDRIAALDHLAEAGIKTWVSFEPVVSPEQSLHLLEIVSDFVDHVKIGKLNNYNGLDRKIDWTRFLDSAVNICRKADLAFYVKKDLREAAPSVQLTQEEMNEDFLNL